jgi:hypothetical protein
MWQCWCVLVLTFGSFGYFGSDIFIFLKTQVTFDTSLVHMFSVAYTLLHVSRGQRVML